MVKIALCDDDTAVCMELEWIISDVFDNMQIEHSIEIFASGEELVRRMDSGSFFDLIFLDIVFPDNGINGVEVGRCIREFQHNHMVSIVYISREIDYVFDLFEIRPLNFLIKPFNRTEVEKILETYLKISGSATGDFSYASGHNTLKVKIKDIIYLESHGRKLILHLNTGEKEEFYGSIKDVFREQLCKFDFLFIHASYVVNFDYISKISYNRLFITDKEVPLPVSQSKRNETREKYFAIMKRRRV